MVQCKQQLITQGEQIRSARPTEAAQRAENWHRRPSDIHWFTVKKWAGSEIWIRRYHNVYVEHFH